MAEIIRLAQYGNKRGLTQQQTVQASTSEGR